MGRQEIGSEKPLGIEPVLSSVTQWHASSVGRSENNVSRCCSFPYEYDAPTSGEGQVQQASEGFTAPNV